MPPVPGVVVPPPVPVVPAPGDCVVVSVPARVVPVTGDCAVAVVPDAVYPLFMLSWYTRWRR